MLQWTSVIKNPLILVLTTSVAQINTNHPMAVSWLKVWTPVQAVKSLPPALFLHCWGRMRSWREEKCSVVPCFHCSPVTTLSLHPNKMSKASREMPEQSGQRVTAVLGAAGLRRGKVIPYCRVLLVTAAAHSSQALLRESISPLL